jgi:hypothetical protein
MMAAADRARSTQNFATFAANRAAFGNASDTALT